MTIYVFIYPLFCGFPSHLGHHRALSRVPWAIQEILIGYLFICSINSVYMPIAISKCPKILFLKDLFIYFLLIALGLHCFASCSEWGLLQLWCMGFALWWLLLLQSMLCRVHGLQELWCSDLVAPWHVGSSLARDWACVPCIGRQILNEWTTREVPQFLRKLRRGKSAHSDMETHVFLKVFQEKKTNYRLGENKFSA